MEYLLWLQSIRNDTLNVILMAVTDFITSPVVYVGLALLYWCINKKAAYFICMNISIGSMVNQTLKNTFCVCRPWIRNPQLKPVDAALESATGYSFPSGHTQIASTEFLSIAAWQRKRKWLVGVCIFVTVLVMFTRNYLGVHTPADVLASLFVSLAVIFADGAILKWVDEKANRDWWVFGLGIVLCTAFLVYSTIKPYPMGGTALLDVHVKPEEMITDCYAAAGSVYGFLIGWICERKLLDFRTDVSRSLKIKRGVIGSVLLLIYALFAQEPLESWHMYWGELAFLGIAFVFIIFIFPAIFVWYEKRRGLLR